MTERRFSDALREARREHLSGEVTPAIDAALRAGITARLNRGRRPVVWAWTLAATAGLALLATAVAPLVRRAGTPRRVGAFMVAERAPAASVSVGADEVVEVARGHARLEDPTLGTVMRVQHRARLRREPEGIRVLLGEVEFRVAKRTADAQPVRVLVSGGAIEVTGTLFEVSEQGSGGTVRLREGAVRFVAPGGETVTLAAGDSESWPLRTTERASKVEAPPVAPPAPPRGPTSSRPDAKAQVDAERVFSHITLLRSRNQYEQAVDELARALRQSFPASTRERLSYERGSILSYLLRDAARACAHWRDHQREFGPGDYAGEVARARLAMGCEGVR